MDETLKELIMRINAVSLFRWHYTKKISNKLGLYRGQYPILKYIEEHPYCQQVDIANSLQVTPASIATSLKRMEKTGFITRQVDEDNHRANKLKVTNKGEEAIIEGRALFKELDTFEFKDFSEEEIKLLRCYVDRILTNLCGGEEFEFEKFLKIVHSFQKED